MIRQKQLFYIWTLLAATALPTALNGQTTAADSLVLRDYNYVKTADPWLTGYNAAALTRYDRRNISSAELSASYAKGGFVDFYQSPRTVDFAAAVESFYRLSPRTVVYGQMSYGSFSGRDMGGSVFINPERLPFDIVEDSLTRNGKKHRDTYQLTGAIGVDLWKGIAVGAKFDYTAANYAKYRDVRHQNKLMDLTLTASIYTPVGKVLDLGATFYYQRKNETMSYGVYGNDERVFKALVNYGVFVGRVEQFGPYGYTGSTFSKPLFELYRGWSAQIDWHITLQIDWYHAYAGINRSGYYGRRSSTSNMLTDHRADIYQYLSRLSYKTRRSHHFIEGGFEIENLVNNEKTFMEVMRENGSSAYEYYESVKASNKVWTNTHIAYTGHWGIRYDLPTWTIGGGYHGKLRKQTAYDYPYYRNQRIERNEFFLRGARNVMLGRQQVLNIAAGISFSDGGGRMFNDQTFAEPSPKQSPPPEMEAYLHREYAYITAPQYAFDISAKYAFVIPNTRMATYVQATFSHRRANTDDIFVIGRDHQAGMLAVGCTF